MSLIKCVNCGGQMSEYAYECPHCHAENVDASRKRIVQINFEKPEEYLSSYDINRQRLNKTQNKKTIIGLVVILVICVIIGIVIANKNGNDELTSNIHYDTQNSKTNNLELSQQFDSDAKKTIDYLCSKIGTDIESSITESDWDNIRKQNPFPCDGTYEFHNEKHMYLSWSPNDTIIDAKTKEEILNVLISFYGEPSLEEKTILTWKDNLTSVSELKYSFLNFYEGSNHDPGYIVLVSWIK